jgi:peptidoglycan/LPS O-acetylase OafA/YrhL
MTVISAAIVFLKISLHPAFSCAMFFYLGCLTAIVYAKVRHVPRDNLIVTVLALAAIVGLSALQFFITVKPMYYLLVLSPALIFLCTAYIRPSAAGARVLDAMGSVTYSSYLLHVPIQISVALCYGWMQQAIPFYSPVMFLAFMAVTLLLSLWCYRYFEVPAQRMVRKKLMRTPARTRAVAQSHP